MQVVKEPLGTKGARITSHLSLPGRFLVYMPTVDHIGVSRKIESRDERRRLRGVVQQFRQQHGLPGGVIIRTAASHRSEEDLTADLRYFQQVWTEIQRRRESERTPAVLFREESLVTKLLRDLLTEQFSSIRIDEEAEHRRILAFIGRIMPNMVSRVRHYTKDYPIFDEYGVQSEIDKALRSKVWLKSGGYIVINQTEALVAIDVNTGRYVGKKTAGRLEDTIVKTNLEAVREIVRQIRLRDLGGIIVLDFIDMEEKKNRQKVAQAVEQELRKRPRAVEGGAGLRFRADHHHPQAREEQSGAAAHRAMSVLFRHGHHQDDGDDLLRHPDRGQEGQRGSRRIQPGVAREPGGRAGAEGREPGGVPGTRVRGRPAGHGSSGRSVAPRAVRLDGDLTCQRSPLAARCVAVQARCISSEARLLQDGYRIDLGGPMARTGRTGVIGLVAALAWFAPSALALDQSDGQSGSQVSQPAPPAPQTGTQTKPPPPPPKPTPQAGAPAKPTPPAPEKPGTVPSKPPATQTGQNLGSVRVPRQAVANGESLAAGTYSVRLVSGPVPGAVGQTPEESKWVEFVQGSAVKGKEVATVMTADEVKKIAEDAMPAPGRSKVQILRGNDYVRVWINRANTHYLVHLALSK